MPNGWHFSFPWFWNLSDVIIKFRCDILLPEVQTNCSVPSIAVFGLSLYVASRDFFWSFFWKIYTDLLIFYWPVPLVALWVTFMPNNGSSCSFWPSLFGPLPPNYIPADVFGDLFWFHWIFWFRSVRYLAFTIFDHIGQISSRFSTALEFDLCYFLKIRCVWWIAWPWMVG